MRAKFIGERSHCVVARAGGDTQFLVALGSRHRDQLAEQDRADTVPAHAALDAERNLGNRIIGLVGRMQLGRPAHHAFVQVCNNDGAVIGALFGVALDKTVVHEAVKAIMAAAAIQPQKVIAQKRQFLLLAQRTDRPLRTRQIG